MTTPRLIPQLFKTEYSKIIAVICKNFGIQNIQLAEDIVSNTFLKATETWGLKGIPENPKAWLYTVAKNNAKDVLKRENLFSTKVEPYLKSQEFVDTEFDIDLSEANIKDSQILMLFSLCNAPISTEVQITLSLRTLCGFGIEEIANALLSTKSTINKRLTRAKQSLRNEEFSPSENSKEPDKDKQQNVLSILYLLFNEGYYSKSSEQSIQRELCFEAMRLLYLLISNPSTNSSDSNALMALFCFHTSRFDARQNSDGTIVLFEDQDKSKWDANLILKGEEFLQKTTPSNSRFFYEAMIAFWHSRKNIDAVKKWNEVLQLYNRLIQIEYSPVTALNRTFALSKVYGNKTALKEALKINLKENHLFHMLIAELQDNSIKQKEHLIKALELAKTELDKNLILEKIRLL